MDNTVPVALISAGSSVLVAITALLLSYRGFASIDGRMAAIDARMSSFEARMSSLGARIDGRLNLLQADMKDLNKTMAALEVDVALVKDKVGL